uniref:Uncharacterized protein n=1 Tax=Parascaris univalens TaxID=6257 RepID=A0A915BHJ0_PARUN
MTRRPPGTPPSRRRRDADARPPARGGAGEKARLRFPAARPAPTQANGERVVPARPYASEPPRAARAARAPGTDAGPSALPARDRTRRRAPPTDDALRHTATPRPRRAPRSDARHQYRPDFPPGDLHAPASQPSTEGEGRAGRGRRGGRGGGRTWPADAGARAPRRQSAEGTVDDERRPDGREAQGGDGRRGRGHRWTRLRGPRGLPGDPRGLAPPRALPDAPQARRRESGDDGAGDGGRRDKLRPAAGRPEAAGRARGGGAEDAAASERRGRREGSWARRHRAHLLGTRRPDEARPPPAPSPGARASAAPPLPLRTSRDQRPAPRRPARAAGLKGSARGGDRSGNDPSRRSPTETCRLLLPLDSSSTVLLSAPPGPWPTTAGPIPRAS